MKKINKSKVIIPALALIALTTAASTTGTAAWFYASRTATVSGMQVKTQVSSSMLIAKDTNGFSGTAAMPDSSFKAGVLNAELPKTILEPVSSVDGTNFFYSTSAKASDDGSVADTQTAKVEYESYTTNSVADSGTDDENYADKFSEDYGVSKKNTLFGTPRSEGDPNKASAFVDFAFQLKVNNVGATALGLKLTNLTLNYAAADTTASENRAFRAALFSSVYTGETSAFATPTLKWIFAPVDGDPTGNINFHDQVENNALVKNKAVAAATDNGSTNETDERYGEITVNSGKYNTPAYDSQNPSTHYITTTAANTKDAYYKIVVRLWIEGEDKTCNTDNFKALNAQWNLTLGLELGGNTTPVVALTTTTNQ